MARPSELTPEQRTEIVLALLRREEPISVLARRHWISANTLNQWKESCIAGGHDRIGVRQTSGAG